MSAVVEGSGRSPSGQEWTHDLLGPVVLRIVVGFAGLGG